MWLTPKTNWKSSDFYNIEDWQRVCTNLEHLCSWMHSLGLTVPKLLEMNVGEGYNALPYVHLVNNLEENLESLQRVFGTSLSRDVSKKTWYDRMDDRYGSNPTYQDWNRWESILLMVYESLQYIETASYSIISGTCYSGSERTLSRFSRRR